MKTKTRMRPSVLSLAVASVLGSASLGAWAQDSAESAEENNIETITVTGIRGSLIRSQDIKRESDGVVDAITAEDIGKMPDTNLAESLQRITGVSIDRQNGEGSKVTVRGFGPDYNLVTLNGRQMPAANIEATSASSSRSFDFANLAAESVSGVQVFKTSMAKQPTGGIGATINISTVRPLENPGLVSSIGVKALTDRSNENGDSVTPELSGIYSNTFADDTFGVAVTASYQRRDSGYNSAETSSGWFTIEGDEGNWGSLPDDGSFVNRPQENDVYSVPRNLLYTFNDVERTRLNSQLTLQWKPIDSVTATLDYTYAELEVEQRRQEMSTWFNGVPAYGEYTQGTNTEGSVVGPVIYADNTCCDVGLGTGQWETKNENKSLGFNLEWEATDNLSFEFDYHSSEAEAGPTGPLGSNNVISAVQFDRVSTEVDYSNDFPVMDITYADGVSGLDPSRMMTSGTSFRNSYMKSEIDQAQLHGTFTFDTGIVETIDFGLASTEVKNRSAFSNAQRDTWGGYGAVEDYPDDIFHQQDLPSMFDNLPGAGSANLEPYYYSASMSDLIKAISDIAATNGETLGPCGTILCADPNYSTDRRTKEEQLSAYVQANLSWDWGDMPVDLKLGLRYEDTEVTSDAVVPTYYKIVWSGANEFTAVSDGEFSNRLEGDYDHVLPSLDFKVEVVEDVIVRASYSKSIARPNYADIQGGQTINELLRLDGGTGTSGNPDLDPFESTNYDLTTEWYYDEGSYVSVAYYLKDVENFIGQTTFDETKFELPHPGQGARYDAAVEATGSTDNAVIRQYFLDQGWVDDNGDIVGVAAEDPSAVFTFFTSVNEKDAEIDGFEIVVQHMFGDSGFGAIANYTTVDGDIGYDNYNTNRDGENQFALFGLSDSANFIFFYDKDGIQARVAYNWRDDFLNGTIDGNGERNPVYIEDYGQWDVNVSYDFNENLTIFAEGINVTDEYSRAYGRHENNLVAIVQSAPRYALGVRYKF